MYNRSAKGASMTTQTEFWTQNDQQKLNDAIKRIAKIEKCESGLFKRLEELKKERIVITAIVEEINHNQIYGER